MNRYVTHFAGALLLAVLIVPAVSAQEVPLTTDSEEARRAFLEGRELQENFHTQKARAKFDAAIAADPDFALAHLYRGFTAASGMEWQKHLEHAVDLADEASEGERLVIMAHKAGNEGGNEERLEMARKLVEMYPNDVRALTYLARRVEDPNESIELLERAIKENPSFAPAHNQLGYVYFQDVADYEKAEESFKRYAELLPNEPNPYDSLADLYVKMGRYEDAIATYNKALEQDPSFVTSQRKIGVSLDLMGKHEEARAARKKHYDLEPDESGKVRALLGKADSHLIEGDVAKTMETLDMAAQKADEADLAPAAAWAHLQKVWIALEHDMVDQAAAHREAAVKYVDTKELPEQARRAITYPLAWSEAMIAAKKGDYDAALKIAEDYKQSVASGEAGGDEHEVNELFGQIYLEKGDHEKAVSHLRETDGDNPYSLYYLALAESKAGNDAEAAELMKQVADWNIDDTGYNVVRGRAQEAVRESGDQGSN